MILTRLSLLAFLALAIGGAAGNALADEQHSVTVTDVAGREVTLKAPVSKMILGEGRFLAAIAVLDSENPVARIAGMGGDLKSLDPSTYQQYRARFPEIDAVPIIGEGAAATFSVEKAIASGPEVAIFGLSGGHGPTAREKPILDQLDAAGIPVVIVDFRSDPLVNTPRSMTLLGKIMGRQHRAVEFLAFYNSQLALVHDRLAGITARPHVFLESRVGLNEACCETIGDAMLGRFVEWAGGINMGSTLVPGVAGLVSIETLLTDQPDIYVATAIGSPLTTAQMPNRIVLGAGADLAQARATLAHAMTRKGVAELDAVKAGRVFTVWHHFYNSPMNVAAVQAMAKWFHPDRFADLDPQATLKTFFDRFQPFPQDGVYWASLD